ncbi:HelD family protein [Cryptosporangium sp. NPDC051539]|uniref:HelD family protein n=1 Tax=Cryptosporangium sp. NPDC051539 TaxID=3363962 RepID=UPI0037A6D0AF
MPDPRSQEIAAEQQIVDRVHEHVEKAREQARVLEREGHGRAAGGSAAGLVERDVLVRAAATRLNTLDAEEEGLVFGRLDFDDGDSYHVGRLGVRDGLEPLLLDWRAPAAAPFYRATAGDPLGVVRRRVILSRGRTVVDLDDDVLTPDKAGGLRVLGEGALLAALRRSRGPHMRDIVTTIQREQDEAIRAPARGFTLISGGPGTGKTQVALHRAAYLLYTDRGRFAEGRILVVGPSTVFTSYIGRVLPSLGEDSVHLRALGELVDGVTATRRDRAEVAVIKGSERMVDLLRDLAWQTPPGAPGRLRLTYAGQVLTLGPDVLATARRRIRSRCEQTGLASGGGTVNSARPIAAEILVEALRAEATRTGTGLDRATFTDDVADRPELRRFLHTWWPALTPAAVLLWLTDPARATGLTSGEADLLSASYRPAVERPAPDWSSDDVPLLDELEQVLGERPPAPPVPEPEWRARELTTGTRTVSTFVLSYGMHNGWEIYAPGHPTPFASAGAQQIDSQAVGSAKQWAVAVILREGHTVVGWTDGFDPHGEEGYVPDLEEPLPIEEEDDTVPDPYRHVILDEAQDLSPMECRLIARRAEYASMTVVGDLGQATHPLASATWSELVERLGKRDVRTLELHTGYRVPEVIADYAARILAPGLPPTRSYRPGGSLSVRHVDDLLVSLADARREAPGDKSVAVVAADGFEAPGVDVVPASLVKGLEYDHVIVVEPADIVAAEPRGLNRLYVVLTRAVASLVVLHRKPLPEGLVSGSTRTVAPLSAKGRRGASGP